MESRSVSEGTREALHYEATKGHQVPRSASEVLLYAIDNGHIYLYVVQQGVKTLDHTIRAGKVAEAAASTTPDAIFVLIMMPSMLRLKHQRSRLLS